MLVEPGQVAVLVLELVELLELGRAHQQLPRQFALALLLLRPDSVRKNFRVHLHVAHHAAVLLRLELFHQIFNETHVREHL